MSDSSALDEINRLLDEDDSSTVNERFVSGLRFIGVLYAVAAAALLLYALA